MWKYEPSTEKQSYKTLVLTWTCLYECEMPSGQALSCWHTVCGSWGKNQATSIPVFSYRSLLHSCGKSQLKQTGTAHSYQHLFYAAPLYHLISAFRYISHLVLVMCWLTMKKKMPKQTIHTVLIYHKTNQIKLCWVLFAKPFKTNCICDCSKSYSLPWYPRERQWTGPTSKKVESILLTQQWQYQANQCLSL